MRVLFLGAGAFGLPSLRALSEHHELVGVVTQPDRPAGRGKSPTPSPIGRWAQTDSGLPVDRVFKPESINEPATRDALRALDADAWVVIAYGQKLGAELLDGMFAINLHGSLLPRWRGAAPINWAILGGDPEAGNTVITLAERMDAGLMLGESRRPLDPSLTAGELHDLLSEDGVAPVLETLDRHASGSLQPESQDESLVTHARKLSRADGWVNFAEPAEACRRRVHGLTPWPGVSARFRGEDLKLLRVDVEEDSETTGGEPGTIVHAAHGLVRCGQGVLRLVEVQRPGKRPGTWKDFANGARPEAGERFESGSKHA
ncbi:MAG: methionyl-tRNA formyltransferase [Planctomycetota bacterium]